MHMRWSPGRGYRHVVVVALVAAHVLLLSSGWLAPRRPAPSEAHVIVWATPINVVADKRRPSPPSIAPPVVRAAPVPPLRHRAQATMAESPPSLTSAPASVAENAAADSDAPRREASPSDEPFGLDATVRGVPPSPGVAAQGLKQAGKADKAVLSELNPWQRPPALHVPKMESAIGKAYVGGAFSVGIARGPDGRTIGRSGTPGRYVCYANDTSGLSRARDSALAPQIKAIPCPDWARR